MSLGGCFRMKNILKQRLKRSKGKYVKVFLKNNFKFEGKITNCDNKFLEILDERLKDYKLIEINKISDLDFMKGGERANE